MKALSIPKVPISSATQFCYIVTDSKPATQYEVLRWIAGQLRVDAPTDDGLLVGGKRLSNKAMLAAGFKLQYPDYQAGYQVLLSEYLSDRTID